MSQSLWARRTREPQTLWGDPGPPLRQPGPRGRAPCLGEVPSRAHRPMLSARCREGLHAAALGQVSPARAGKRWWGSPVPCRRLAAALVSAYSMPAVPPRVWWHQAKPPLDVFRVHRDHPGALACARPAESPDLPDSRSLRSEPGTFSPRGMPVIQAQSMAPWSRATEPSCLPNLTATRAWEDETSQGRPWCGVPEQPLRQA